MMRASGIALILVLYAGSVRATDDVPRGLDVAKAFRDCALVQKVDARTLTDHGKEAAKSCIQLALAYEDGDIVDTGTGERIAVNYKLAMRYYMAACKATITYGCVALGQMYEGGRTPIKKGPSAQAEAAKWYAYGCYVSDGDQSEIKLSCSLAGTLTFKVAIENQGKVRPRVFRNAMSEAVKMSQRACELGDDTSCRLLAKIEQIMSEDK